MDVGIGFAVVIAIFDVDVGVAVEGFSVVRDVEETVLVVEIDVDVVRLLNVEVALGIAEVEILDGEGPEVREVGRAVEFAEAVALLLAVVLVASFGDEAVIAVALGVAATVLEVMLFGHSAPTILF